MRSLRRDSILIRRLFSTGSLFVKRTIAASLILVEFGLEIYPFKTNLGKTGAEGARRKCRYPPHCLASTPGALKLSTWSFQK